MQIIIRAAARRQLDIAIEQGEQKFGITVATKFYNRFMEYAKRLSTNSELGFQNLSWPNVAGSTVLL